jgi:2-pyrone-4,6-dicarboxylate lactonase
VLDLNKFHPNPSKPTFAVPPGSVDAHCHIFGPGDEFPYAPQRKYTPGDAGKADLYRLRDFLGLSRNVIVQASCHGTDNTATIDGIAHAQGKARGVAVVDLDISLAELQAMDAAGIRGVRFAFLKRLVDPTPPEKRQRVIEMCKELGWHIVVYFESPDLEELQPFFESLPTTVVIDHMGRPDAKLGTDAPQWKRFLKMLDEHPNMWIKVTGPERISALGPPYDDVVPFGKALVERYPDRVLWGTDWPHPNMETHMPDDGKLVDFIPRVAVTPELQHKLLVDNPMRLYWPEELPDSKQ